MSNTIYKTLTCSKCGKEFNIDKRLRRKTCSKICRDYRSPEVLNKLSISRKKYLRENRDKHPWKNKEKYISKPCEHLKSILLSKNINFVEEYNPIQSNSYSIDIAFPDIKVGIEVNGNQHYNSDKTLAPYYKKRHDKIESEGWVLYEIHYSKVYDSEFVDELLCKINLKENIIYDFYIKKSMFGPPPPNKTQLKYINDMSILEHLKNSSIDFTKFGWVNEAASIIKITPQKVGSWVKRVDPDFYETCYKRKKKGS